MVFENGLETMRQVANSGSFTGAARALGISGAAVSRQIKALESRLGSLSGYSHLHKPGSAKNPVNYSYVSFILSFPIFYLIGLRGI